MRVTHVSSMSASPTTAVAQSTEFDGTAQKKTLKMLSPVHELTTLSSAKTENSVDEILRSIIFMALIIS